MLLVRETHGGVESRRLFSSLKASVVSRLRKNAM